MTARRNFLAAIGGVIGGIFLSPMQQKSKKAVPLRRPCPMCGKKVIHAEMTIAELGPESGKWTSFSDRYYAATGAYYMHLDGNHCYQKHANVTRI